MRWLHIYRPALDRTPIEGISARRDDQVARRVIERLAEDETLRGDLTDDAFKPIFDWVTSLVPVAAHRAGPESDAEDAGEQLSQAARQLVRAFGQAASTGDASSLRDELSPPLLTVDEADRLLQALPSSQLPEHSAGDRAVSLIRALNSALPGEQTG